MKLKFAVVCSSNMNRSMEAHSVLAKKKFCCISSFGTGSQIKIPGKSKAEPNCYPFGTTYDAIYKDLVAKDRRHYSEMGLLHMLERNRRIKSRPEKFQECEADFDVILTCEEKVYDQVVAVFDERPSVKEQPVHVVNMDVVDNPEDATIGAFLLCELGQIMAASEDLDDEMEDIVRSFEAKYKRDLLHSVQFY